MGRKKSSDVAKSQNRGEKKAQLEHERRRMWLFLPLVLALITFSVCVCSWLATVNLLPRRVLASGESMLVADYRRWEGVRPINLDIPRLATAAAQGEGAWGPGAAAPSPTGVPSEEAVPPTDEPPAIVEVTSASSPVPPPTRPARTPAPVSPPAASVTPIPALPTATLTNSPVPTRTPTRTNTPVPTNTPAGPTNTPTSTNTPTDTPTFTPTSTDTPVPPSVSFSAASFSVGEGGGIATITVVLSAASGNTVTVDYATSNGSATAGSDYTAVSNTLTFTPSQVSGTFDVPITNDPFYESGETVILTLSNPTNATLGAPNPATLTITDNESGGPDIGPPDGGITSINAGTSIIIDLGGTPLVANGDGAFDLVFYERGVPASTPTEIQLDWIAIQIATSPTGPWITVFYWGNGSADLNSNIGQAGWVPPEADNAQIPLTDLWLGSTTGVAIDIDALVPPGAYPYIQILCPAGGADPAEVDAVELL